MCCTHLCPMGSDIQSHSMREVQAMEVNLLGSSLAQEVGLERTPFNFASASAKIESGRADRGLRGCQGAQPGSCPETGCRTGR